MNTETVWSFETARFTVQLNITQDYGYQYDGDDEDGEVQDNLNNGEYVAFNSEVRVLLDGVEIGSDSLGGSVYGVNEVSEFWTAHRSADPLNRNCSIMRAAHGSNCSICHYFPGMVSEAIAAARQYLAAVPQLRAA